MIHRRLASTERKTIRFYLDLMAVKHKPVKEHCVRVARFSTRVSKALCMDMKAAYLAGMFHDIGKLLLDSDLFTDRNISKEEYEKIKGHSVDGYKALSHLMPFTSLCCGFHHSMSEGGGYGLKTEDLPKHLSPRTVKKLLGIAEIVSICDFIDAFQTRKTDLLGKTGSDTGLRSMLCNRFPESDEIIATAIKIMVNK